MATTILKTTAQVLGLAVSGIFAGYTLSLSQALVPCILAQTSSDHSTHSISKDHAEPLLLSQWRHIYVRGAQFARPSMLISVLCFGYLAFLSPDLRWLYVFAAVTAGSGPPFALTVLRRTNGELSLRCLRLIGSPPEHLRDPVITFVNGEYELKIHTDMERSTSSLVEEWNWLNQTRTGILITGVLAGACAVVLDQGRKAMTMYG